MITNPGMVTTTWMILIAKRSLSSAVPDQRQQAPDTAAVGGTAIGAGNVGDMRCS